MPTLSANLTQAAHLSTVHPKTTVRVYRWVRGHGSRQSIGIRFEKEARREIGGEKVEPVAAFRNGEIVA